MTVEIRNHDFETMLLNAEQTLGAGGETLLDFSSVTRLDANALHTLHDLAAAAEKQSAKIAIRGANVAVYKVLKLVRLSRRFQFVD